MEKFKQYLPYIIGAAIVLYVVSRMRTKQTILAPQTQMSETLPIDPYAEQRFGIFQGLLDFAKEETKLDFAREQASIDRELAREKNTLEAFLSFEAIEAGIERAKISSDSVARLANLEIAQRAQDIEGQRYAIDRYYQTRGNSNTAAIIGSIGQTLGGLFGNRDIIRTPPTFPTGGFF